MTKEKVDPLNEHLQDSSAVVHIAESVEDIEAAKAKLKEILYTPNNFEYHDENDDTEGVVYVIAKDGDEVIGAGRLRINPLFDNEEGEARLQAMESVGFNREDVKARAVWFYGIALDEKYRGQHIGSKLYEVREQVARERGRTLFLASARPDSWNIYLNRGYQLCGKKEVKLGNGTTIERKWFYRDELAG